MPTSALRIRATVVRVERDGLPGRGNGNRTKEIELMELGLTCSKFLKRSCEIELISYFLKQELELICYWNWN